MARRIPLAIVKKIPSPYYQRFGYNDLNAYLRGLSNSVALFLEDQGYESFPLDPSVDEREREVKIPQEEPEPMVKILGDFSHRHAIVQSGLGEISAGCMVVVPKFGPRIRLVSVITTAPLEPDPCRKGRADSIFASRKLAACNAPRNARAKPFRGRHREPFQMPPISRSRSLHPGFL